MQKCMKCMADIGEEEFCPHCGNEIARAYWKNGQLAEGTVLRGKYIVGQVLQRDASGITYIAWDAEQESRIALREWFPEKYAARMEDGIKVEFQLEEEVAQNLKKQFCALAEKASKDVPVPALTQIFSVFKQNQTAYYTMEYPDGITIEDLLKRENPLPEKKAAEIFEKLSKAAEQMHVRGIIHGNLNPGNVIMTKNGEIEFLGRGWVSPDVIKAKNAFFCGNYAAPEWYSSKITAAHDTDTYSIYAIYYRMLTGMEPCSMRQRSKGRKMKLPSELGIHIRASVEEELIRELEIETGGASSAEKSTKEKRTANQWLKRLLKIK